MTIVHMMNKISNKIRDNNPELTNKTSNTVLGELEDGVLEEG